MRITFVLKTADRSGGVRVVATYAEALAAAGHEVHVFSTRTAVPPRQRLRNMIRGRGGHRLEPVPPHPLDGLKHVEHTVLEDARPVGADDLPDADVVVATWWETAEWVAELPGNKGEPVYLIQHDESVFPGLTEAQRARVRATWTLPMRRVVVSNWIRDRVLAHLRRIPDGFDHGRPARATVDGSGTAAAATLVDPAAAVQVINNGIDTRLFNAPPRNKADRPTIVVMHSGVPFKGFDVAAQVLEALKQQTPELRCVAFGPYAPGPDSPLPSWAEFVCDPGDVAAVYARGDLYLFTSRAEGFGLPLLEAMACRTPVVATRTGAAGELVPRDLLCGIDDVDALVAACRRVLTLDDAAWSAASAAARATAEAHTWPAAVTAFELTLQEAAAGF